MDATSFIQQYQKQWFERIHPYLLDTNLNIGSGLGHFSFFAERAGIKIVSLEIIKHPKAVNVKNFILYDGRRMPFDDNAFETSIATYVLHHAFDRKALLEEMRRVTSKRIILVEELYHNFFGKIQLALLDFWVNFRLKQKSPIHWQSFFSSDGFRREVENGKWHISHFEGISKGGFDEVLCVLEKS
ncbi:MAG: class I SAM-dependent methyltransferase [Minisyncoccia bacterium]|jgi:ubiquinone/menaquinone biosynthesis C-methylase UbiE